VTCIGSEISAPGVTSITPDYAAASQMAIDYLFKLGHRNLAILSGSFGSVDYRIIELNRGVRLSCERHGMPVDSQHILHGELTFKNGAASTEQLLARKPRPTAIFCFSDTVAAGALAAAYRCGLKVPGDISIIGCSNDSFAEFLLPALTTIHIPVEEMAEAAVQDVERRVRESDSSGSRKIVLPARLVERASCGAPGCK
jgi:DNA-binding LacI/PurR family transcriptional regulator